MIIYKPDWITSGRYDRTFNVETEGNGFRVYVLDQWVNLPKEEFTDMIHACAKHLGFDLIPHNTTDLQEINRKLNRLLTIVEGK